VTPLTPNPVTAIAIPAIPASGDNGLVRAHGQTDASRLLDENLAIGILQHPVDAALTAYRRQRVGPRADTHLVHRVAAAVAVVRAIVDDARQEAGL